MLESERPQRSQVTIDMVAQRAGVSISTVSRVLNQTVHVAEETSARVLAAVAELGYVPHTAARNLAQGKTNTLGLLLPDISADFFWPLLRGITLSAADAGYGLLIAIRRPGDTLQLQLPPLGRHNTDGLIIFDRSVHETELRQLASAGVPMVLLYRSAPGDLPIPTIMIENKAGARQLVDHLIEMHGCRRIGYLRGPDSNEDSRWRELGYRESLAAHGLPFDPALVGAGAFQEQPARDTVAGWLDKGLEFDAIFGGDDGSARGALAALAQAGLSVPGDVALAGFDDSPLARHLSPPLTTVRAPTEQVGQEAVAQLVRLIRTGQADRVRLLPTELIIRRSCGCPY